MKNPKEENFFVQALDERIRAIVEEVLADLLTGQSEGARGAAAERSGRTVTNYQAEPTTRRRGRPRKGAAEIAGRIVKQMSTPQGTVIYTDRDKYLRRRDGSVIRVSHVKGSLEPVRAMGYSSAEYQLARRHHWPMPCPMDFEPPTRARRGRRAKVAKA